LIFKSSDRIVSVFLKWLYQADGSVFNGGRGRRAISYKSVDLNLLLDIQLILLRFGIHSRVNGNNLLISRGESMIKFAKYIGFVDDNKNKKLQELTKEAYDFQHVGRQVHERIVSIEYKEELQDVYDIEVEKFHSFIANGIVSHNTGKSEFGRTFLKLIPKSVYVQADAATGVGLTSAVMPPDEWVQDVLSLVLYRWQTVPVYS
jgi:intein/homing endonuclease